MSDLVHLNVAVPENKVGAFYSMLGALLGGTAVAAVAAATVRGSTAAEAAAPAPNASAPVADAAVAGDGAGAASNDDGVDAAGWPWSADLHASTKGVTKEGLWRMKVGVSRPDPKPGFPKADAQTGGTGTAASTSSASPSGTAETPAATSTVDDEDEFAAFRAAADKANGTDAAAAASIPARKWTDADLGALCNQAAVKLGDPAPVKAVIADHIPEGVLPHSRNIPEDQRETFAKVLEAKAGITFAG